MPPKIPQKIKCTEFAIPPGDLTIFTAPWDGFTGGLGITEKNIPELLNAALVSEGPGSEEWRTLKESEPEKFEKIKALYYYLASDI